MMLCDLCKCAADHPSNFNPDQVQLKHCSHDGGCACGNKIGSVEALFDADRVDLEWVRTRRITVYSNQTQ